MRMPEIRGACYPGVLVAALRDKITRACCQVLPLLPDILLYALLLSAVVTPYVDLLIK